MSRYAPTLIFLLALLVVGGVAINTYVLNPSVHRTGYVPTITSQEEGFILLGGIVGSLVVLGGMATGLAMGLQRLSQMTGQLEAQEAAAKAAAAKAAPAKPAAKPAAAEKAPEPQIPFTSVPSLIALGIFCVALFLAMQLPKYIGVSLGYLFPPSSTIEAFGVANAPSEFIAFIINLVASVLLTLLLAGGLAFALPKLANAIGNEEAKAKAAAAAAAAAAKAAGPAKPVAAKPAPAKAE